MNRDEYAELPPAQIWARELDAGRYHCSVSTMYRILREKGQNGERRRQAAHPTSAVPELVATAPSQVFTWDITKAAGPAKSIWYHAYVIIDIFSRYIAGHTVERAESALQAEELVRETITRNGIVPQTVHSAGAPSRSSPRRRPSRDPPRPRRSAVRRDPRSARPAGRSCPSSRNRPPSRPGPRAA
ncbi:DDE-type integrase/transposase/recombinase [Streptomyces sp900116325]|uniref:DDE-type integrase/transposase/recombinase n=1 Tax=Streptomyces sp. 900116325 TaxID=3154295 RepID=UPI00339F773A